MGFVPQPILRATSSFRFRETSYGARVKCIIGQGYIQAVVRIFDVREPIQGTVGGVDGHILGIRPARPIASGIVGVGRDAGIGARLPDEIVQAIVGVEGRQAADRSPPSHGPACRR